MRTHYELPEHPRLTRLERLIINMTPEDWSDEQAEAFAMKHGPLLLEDLNAAIRAEQEQPQTPFHFGVMSRNN